RSNGGTNPVRTTTTHDIKTHRDLARSPDGRKPSIAQVPSPTCAIVWLIRRNTCDVRLTPNAIKEIPIEEPISDDASSSSAPSPDVASAARPIGGLNERNISRPAIV